MVLFLMEETFIGFTCLMALLFLLLVAPSSIITLLQRRNY